MYQNRQFGNVVFFWHQICWVLEYGNYQTPPDLVVKFQPIDIVDVILWRVVRLRVVYQREIKG